MTSAAHAPRKRERDPLGDVHAAVQVMTGGQARLPAPGEHARPSFSRILVGHDGTPASAHALEWAARLARMHDARVIVASVAPPDLLASAPWAFAYPVPVVSDHREVVAKFRDIADAAAAQLRAAKLDAQSVSAEGDPTRELARIARTHRADLVVLGAKTAGEIGRVLLGSTADSLLGRIEASVLVARAPPRARRVLVAVDGSAPSHRAAAVALRYAAHHGADLVVQHVIDAYDDVGRMPSQGFLRDVIARMKLPTPPRVSYVIDAGRPAREIVRRAERDDVDLIVMGARGLGRISGALLGSVSHRVANAGRGNVLIVREPVSRGSAWAGRGAHASTDRACAAAISTSRQSRTRTGLPFVGTSRL